MSISLLSFSECMLTLYFNRFLYLKIKLFDLRLNFNFFKVFKVNVITLLKYRVSMHSENDKREIDICLNIVRT